MQENRTEKIDIQPPEGDAFWKGLLDYYHQDLIILNKTAQVVYHNLESGSIPWLNEFHLQKIIHDNCEEDHCPLRDYLAGITTEYEQQISLEDERTLNIKGITYLWGTKNYCILMLDDITDKLTNELILKSNERRLRNYLDASPYVFMNVDLRGRIKSVQSRGDGKLNLPDILVGKYIRDVLPFRSFTLLEKGISDTREQTNLVVLKERWSAGDISKMVEVRAISSGKNEVALLLKDLSDWEVNENHKDLLERNTAAQEITRSLNRDLLENFNVIMSHLHWLNESGLNEKQLATMEKLQMTAKDSLAMLKGISSFSNSHPEEEEMLDIDGMINEAVDFCRYGLNDQIELIVHPVDKNYEIWGSKSQFVGVLINLIMNSREALEGKGRIELSHKLVHLNTQSKANVIGSWATGDFHCIEVKDNGKGIQPEMLDKIFDPLFTTKGNKASSGMGLTILKNFIYEINGGISVKSHVGKGTSFFIYLPAEQSREDIKHILIIDSDSIRRESLADVLSPMEHQEIHRISKFSETVTLLDSFPEKMSLFLMYEDQFKSIDEEGQERLKGEKVLLIGENEAIIDPYIERDDWEIHFHNSNWGNDALQHTIKNLVYGQIDSSLTSENVTEQLLFPDRAIELLEGNQELHQTICRDFLIDYGSANDNINEALGLKQWESARIIVHSIKGLAGLIGSIRLQDVCRDLEDTLKYERTKTLKKDLHQFSITLSGVLLEVEHYLEKNIPSQTFNINPENASFLKAEIYIPYVDQLLKNLEFSEYNETLACLNHIVDMEIEPQHLEALNPLIEWVKRFDFGRALSYLQDSIGAVDV